MIPMFLTTVSSTGDMVAKAVQDIDFSPIFTEYMNVLPVVLPISILFISVEFCAIEKRFSMQNPFNFWKAKGFINLC